MPPHPRKLGAKVNWPAKAAGRGALFAGWKAAPADPVIVFMGFSLVNPVARGLLCLIAPRVAACGDDMNLAAFAGIDPIAPPPRQAAADSDAVSFDDHLEEAAAGAEADDTSKSKSESEEPPVATAPPPTAPAVEPAAAPILLQIEPAAIPVEPQDAVAPVAPPPDGDIAATAAATPQAPPEARDAATTQRPTPPEHTAKAPASAAAPAIDEAAPPSHAPVPVAAAPEPQAAPPAQASAPPPSAAPDMLAALQALAGLRANRDAQNADPQRSAETIAAEAEGKSKRSGAGAPEPATTQAKTATPAAFALAAEASAMQRASTDAAATSTPASQLSALSSGAAQALHTPIIDSAVRAAPLIAQVGREIIRRFNGQSTQFDLRLDPPELGRVDVRLDVSRDHRVTAIITADNPQALAELVRHARDLQHSLQSAGLQLADNGLAFDLRQGRDDAQQSQHGRGDGVLANADQEHETPALLAPRPLGYERWRGVRLDVMV
jgi:flagellar hook-length control protein FliK